MVFRSELSTINENLDYPVGLETGFLGQIWALIPKIIEETGFLG